MGIVNKRKIQKEPKKNLQVSATSQIHDGNPKTSDLLTLYGNLVNQIQKFNDVIWQFPSALLLANLLLLKDNLDFWPGMLAILIFNFAAIYAFYKMVFSQKDIINATKALEAKLNSEFPGYIPMFPYRGPSAPKLLLLSLSLLQVILIVLFINNFIINFIPISQDTSSIIIPTINP
jgi:hypothetical protein